MREIIDNIRTRSNYKEELESFTRNYFTNILSLSDSIYNSNRIEGSSLTLGETISIVNNKHGNSLEELEVIGLAHAMDFMKHLVKGKFAKLDVVLLHELLMKDINPSNAGIVRLGDAYTYVRNPDSTVKKFYYARPEEIEYLLEKLMENPLETLDDVILFKLKLVTIHPFSDGNGRVSRLVLNWLLIQTGYPPITLKGEDSDRDLYLNAMTAFSSRGNVEEFTKIVESEIVNSYKHFKEPPRIKNSSIF